MHYVYQYISPLGDLTLASDGKDLIGLWFNNQKYFAQTLKHIPQSDVRICTDVDLHIFKQTINWLDIYFAGRNPDFIPSIRMIGTPFQMKVWQILMDIPYGQTITYKDIAKEICRQTENGNMSCQAVGNAVGRNPISLIIPCHRVIGSNGSLIGYAGGLDKKRRLLMLEQHSSPTLA